MSFLPTKQQFATWLHDPNLSWFKQHPIAHAAGGAVFLALATLDRWIFGLGLPYRGVLLFALLIEPVAAIPIVADENQHRPMQFGVVRWPLLLTWAAVIFGGAYVVPPVWHPWLLASGAQLTWELLQRSAWVDPTTGQSTYPWYSVVLDAGTASTVAAVITFVYLLMR